MFLYLTAKTVRTYVGIYSLFCTFLIILIRMITYIRTTLETSTQTKKQRTKEPKRKLHQAAGQWWVLGGCSRRRCSAANKLSVALFCNDLPEAD